LYTAPVEDRAISLKIVKSVSLRLSKGPFSSDIFPFNLGQKGV
jgi:hypothetical protein